MGSTQLATVQIHGPSANSDVDGLCRSLVHQGINFQNLKFLPLLYTTHYDIIEAHCYGF